MQPGSRDHFNGVPLRTNRSADARLARCEIVNRVVPRSRLANPKGLAPIDAAQEDYRRRPRECVDRSWTIGVGPLLPFLQNDAAQWVRHDSMAETCGPDQPGRAQSCERCGSKCDSKQGKRCGNWALLRRVAPVVATRTARPPTTAFSRAACLAKGTIQSPAVLISCLVGDHHVNDRQEGLFCPQA